MTAPVAAEPFHSTARPVAGTVRTAPAAGNVMPLFSAAVKVKVLPDVTAKFVLPPGVPVSR